MDVEAFRDEIVSVLGENLTCLIHHGSRVRGEAREDSDYDFAFVLSRVDGETLDKIRDALSSYPNISVYILDRQDLARSPRAYYATFLQFVYSERLYGNCDFPEPTAEDIDAYVDIVRTEEIFTLRHYLTLPHDPNVLVGRILIRLKYAYFCLKYLIYKETGVLPKTRLETISYLRRKSDRELGIRLLGILEGWLAHKASVAENPHEHLHMLEEFWRTL